MSSNDKLWNSGENTASEDIPDEENALGALNQTLFAKTIGTIKEKGKDDNEIIFV